MGAILRGEQQGPAVLWSPAIWGWPWSSKRSQNWLERSSVLVFRKSPAWGSHEGVLRVFPARNSQSRCLPRTSCNTWSACPSMLRLTLGRAPSPSRTPQSRWWAATCSTRWFQGRAPRCTSGARSSSCARATRSYWCPAACTARARTPSLRSRSPPGRRWARPPSPPCPGSRQDCSPRSCFSRFRFCL